MHEISRRLLFYKQKNIQQQIVESSLNREVGIRYGDRGYGKRPDILMYPNDLMSPVTKGATSFHVSEERWENPLNLETGMNRKQLDELRIGWDLVLDIDCPYWFFSKLITHLFIQALKNHGIKNISCKFSGNKGFHIGVPFEAFPEEVNNQLVKNMFPTGPRDIAKYLLEYIGRELVKQEDEKITFDGKISYTISELSKELEMNKKDMTFNLKCKNCKKLFKKKQETNYEYLCDFCSHRKVYDTKQKIPVCERCNKIMNEYIHKKNKCENCGSTEFIEHSSFNPLSIVEVDTILISSRHMYRAPYSLHEKSGLVSLPINPDEVLEFKKEYAKTENIKDTRLFLDSKNIVKGEATQLLVNAFDDKKENIQYSKFHSEEENKKYEYDEITQAIPIEFFPPCILKILDGLEDGKKRSLFLLTNFLTSVGWSHNQSEKLLIEWNNKNNPKLNVQAVKNQVFYHKRKKVIILPPNCKSYYQDFRVCNPDSLCDRIKNPVQYTKRKSGYKPGKTNTPRLTDEQKEMRRKHRERLKKKKANIETNETKT